MSSHKDNNSEAPTEQTSYFNASYFPESSYLSEDILDANYDFNGHFDQGEVTAFQTPQSYDNLRKKMAEEKTTTASSQGLILGSTTDQYQPYYPTEEVPITEGLGTDLINWKLCSRNSSSYTGSRSHTSGQRTSRPSKNGQTPPTVCETATIVEGGNREFELDDIDLDEVRKQDFTYLPRFNKQKDIIKNVENAAQQAQHAEDGAQDQYPSLASTSDFFPAWEIQHYKNTDIHDPALNNMGMHFAYDADSTVSKSQTQSSIFTGGNRRASGTAPSVTSYTDSSINDSALSERFNVRRIPAAPNYPKFLEDDGFTNYSGYSRYDNMGNECSQYPPITSDLQQVLDTVLENVDFNGSMGPPPLTSSFSSYSSGSQQKRHQSFSASPPPSKRRLSKKDHVCGTCNAIFTEKTNLTRHVKSRKCTKGGPDMFRCPVDGCPRSYEGRSDNLKTHMKRVHREEWKRLKGYQGDWREKNALSGFLYLTA
ncbi:hypothetical protein ABW19_dt0208611 [Dactylella cylindrospora]|nr:hypothetical protein ABW19_dt0208611 [Dactylella cylindrospora]